jgi:hypothetical protein
MISILSKVNRSDNPAIPDSKTVDDSLKNDSGRVLHRQVEGAVFP